MGKQDNGIDYGYARILSKEQRRLIRHETAHAIRVRCRAICESVARKGRLTPERAKGVGLHFIAAFEGRAIKPKEWEDLHKNSTAQVFLIQA